jgi:hypothetical protein
MTNKPLLSNALQRADLAPAESPVLLMAACLERGILMQ